MPPGPESRDASPSVERAPRSVKDQLLAGAVPRVLASLLIAGGFSWLLARGGLPLVPPEASLHAVPAWAVGAFFLLQLSALLFRTYRWVFLLRPLTQRINRPRIVGIGFIGFSAIFFAPLRMGEIVRPYLLAQDGEVSFMQAGGTLFAERVIDGLVLSCFTLTALSFATTLEPLPSSLGDLPLPLAAIPAAVYSATLAFIGLSVAMAAFYAARNQARWLTRRVVGLVSARAAEWAAGTLERVAEGLQFLPSRRPLFSFVGATCGAWGCMILAQWVLLRASGLPANVLHAATMVGVMSLGAIVPAGPGLFGAYQIAGFSALALFFPLEQVRTAGAAMIFYAYAAQLALSTMQVPAGFWMMARYPSSTT